MLIDKRIEELTKKGAKKLLRRAVEVIAERMECHACAMKIVCGEDQSEDDCMQQVLVLLAVPTIEDEEGKNGEEAETVPNGDATICDDPKTMKIEK